MFKDKEINNKSLNKIIPLNSLNIIASCCQRESQLKKAIKYY